MNTIDELNKLHAKSANSETELNNMIDGLNQTSADFNFKFIYDSPTKNGIVIERKDGTNKIYVDGSNSIELFSFLDTVFSSKTETTNRKSSTGKVK